ncbi:DUF5107 domain-containing protein [Aestuariimicrobium sp. p3-SID1156]|uniref:DUF5107 domain-containing protein n=1 Tax=Aestuariimicrobium sp. p3-SID1156 TaxID=2916038 RepID=UPI00223BC9FA|nr:DUF5107 domain-containing protein [Aestuariimicrobium sp. p3-SID1156]MCT1458291.1 DUF5107 domain-containing protein [Aestuariimicrobium sp. p3-SID1156]
MAVARVQIVRTSVRAAGLDRDPGLPILHNGGARPATPEEEELLGVGSEHMARPATVLPYRQQGAYDRTPVDVEMRVAVLENEHLRAEFLLDLGGRLWSLFDKDPGRELLHQPDWIQHGNLALRNAWFAGGVEWNLGVTGHWALTSEPISAAVVEADGVQVLRMWAYERMLELVWRLDVHLPQGSEALFTHVTLHNPHDTDRPVYWWSNIAVPQTQASRVLVDAHHAYHFGYVGKLHVVPVPEHGGRDISRPVQAAASGDFFFQTDAEHPWIAAVEGDGYGLGQASTARLRSRKLFVWGNSPGGSAWQRWLSGEGSYIEIQAGLAPTQLEHLRLPAGDTWSWTESYRAVQLDPATAGGPWGDAVAAAGSLAAHAEELDASHELLVSLASLPVGQFDAFGAEENQAWGALAVAVGDLPEDPATPFDPSTMTAEQRGWLELARTGAVAPELVGSVLVGEHWLGRLRSAETSPVQQLLRGYAEHAVGDTVLARELWQQSADAEPTAEALHALAATTHDAGAAADLLTRALPLAFHWEEPALDGLLVATLAALQRAGQSHEVLDVISRLSERQRVLPRVAFAECRALVDVGELEAAEALLARPLVLPDLREGDRSLDELWFDYQRARGTVEPLPPHYDFRMFGGHVEEG